MATVTLSSEINEVLFFHHILLDAQGAVYHWYR